MADHFVFDLDGAIAIVMSYTKNNEEIPVREHFGDAFHDRHCITVLGYPHYIFPGYFALFRWLHGKEARLSFFSSGTEERNVPLVAGLMQRAFGEEAANVPYRTFSRQHCIDTSYLNEEARKRYQSCHYGQLKKKLAGVVVSEEELPNTLLIDDDESYMTRGEEYNFIGLRYAHTYFSQSYPRGDNLFLSFHAAFYLAGLLSAVLRLRDTDGSSLIAAAKQLQYDAIGAELNADFRFPTLNVRDYYLAGRDVLRGIEPNLDFFLPMPKDWS